MSELLENSVKASNEDDKLKPMVRKVLEALTEAPIFKEIEDSVKNHDHDHRLKIHSAISHHPSLNTGFGHNLEVNLGLAEHHEFNQLDLDLLQMINSSQEMACALKSVTPQPDGHCPTYWDGILCWPSSPPGSNAVLKCFEELEGVKYDSTQNASRFCQLSGVWANYSDYSTCSEKTDMTGGEGSPYTELTSHLYLGGYSLSLAALCLAVGIFLYFKDLRCLRNTIHTNLMSTYILFGLIWILHLNLQVQVQKDNIGCLLLVVFFHYFYLTNFFWMLVEGLYLYMLVVETFTGENITLRVYASIGWGAPAVFVTLWTVVRVFVPMEPGSSENSELAYIPNIRMCEWMQEHPCDWIYKGPAIGGLALNLLFLIRIMWVLITKLRSANTLETQQYRKATKALLVLIPLLGITYLVVLYGPTTGYSAVLFDYARAILLSTQGFTVALFYCFLNTEVQNTIKHHYERWQAKRTVGGGRRYHYNYTKDWSPRSRTESIRLYSQPTNIYHKRESTASETTTTTLVGFAGQHQIKGQVASRPPNSISPKLLQAYNSTTIENTAV